MFVHAVVTEPTVITVGALKPLNLIAQQKL